MSIKEIAYDIVDNLTEEQLKGFIMMFRGARRSRCRTRSLPKR